MAKAVDGVCSAHFLEVPPRAGAVAEVEVYVSRSSSPLVVLQQPPFYQQLEPTGMSLRWESSCSPAAALVQGPSNLQDRGGGSGR